MESGVGEYVDPCGKSLIVSERLVVLRQKADEKNVMLLERVIQPKSAIRILGAMIQSG